MHLDPTYQNRYQAYPMNREQDGYAMNGYAAPPPGMSFPFSIPHLSSISYLSTPALSPRSSHTDHDCSL